MMLVLYSGAFGKAVAEALDRNRATEAVPLADRQGLDELFDRSGDSFVVFALDRPHPEFLEDLDDSLEARRLRWTAVTLRHRTLICGPLHKPGLGPCWRCYNRRHLTLTLPPYTPEIESAYNRACDTAMLDEVEGFLPTMVEMAAAQILRHEQEYEALAHGSMAVFDVFEGSLTPTKVVPLHGCCCRPTESDAGPERFVRHLRAVLGQGASS
jgi:bacteriocin biosynthesis cyclodehydratase domain-containing protein